MRVELVVELAESFNPAVTPDHLDDACRLKFFNPILEVGPNKTALPRIRGSPGRRATSVLLEKLREDPRTASSPSKDSVLSMGTSVPYP